MGGPDRQGHRTGTTGLVGRRQWSLVAGHDSCLTGGVLSRDTLIGASAGEGVRV